MALSVDIHCDVTQAEALLSNTAERVALATDQALNRTAQVVLNEYRRRIRRTYSRPIPMSSKGVPKWERSGALLEGAVIEGVGPTERKILVKGEAAAPIKNYPEGYAEKLTILPRSKDGVNRRNNFPEDARKTVEPQVEKVFEQTLRNYLRLP